MVTFGFCLLHIDRNLVCRAARTQRCAGEVGGSRPELLSRPVWVAFHRCKRWACVAIGLVMIIFISYYARISEILQRLFIASNLLFIGFLSFFLRT
jgi:hypothetical protein